MIFKHLLCILKLLSQSLSVLGQTIYYNLTNSTNNMGCNQSAQQDANEPVANSTIVRNNSGLLNNSHPKSSHSSPNSFLLTLIGNTATNGLVLGFSGQQFAPLPCRVSIPRYCHATLTNQQTGYITGGIQDLQSNVSTKATIDQQILQGNISKKFYKVNITKLIEEPASSLEAYPDMINARYAHTSIVHQKYLYVIGGRQYGPDQQGLLAACEKYDFSARKWKAIASLQYPRAAGAVIGYGSHLYVFGGYSGANTRTRVIETYSDGDSAWKKLPFLLHEGFEGALVLKKPGSQTSVLIFGGKHNLERSSRVVQLNIDRQTVKAFAPMKQGRSFHKGKLINNDIYLIGGGCQSIEAYSPLHQTSQYVREVSYLEYCTMKELNAFSQFQQSIKLSHQKRGDIPKFQNKVSVFGHAHEPFAYHINLQNMMVNSQGQSLAHNFYQFTNVIKVNKEYCFVLGGISCDLADVATTLYSYHLESGQIKYLEPMTQARYAFASTVLGSHLYVVGGRKLGDDQAAIMGLCQRFSFQSYQWEQIAPLKYRRQSATAVPVGEYVLVIGGYKQNGSRANELELYIPNEDRWVELQAKFQISVQGMTAIEYQGAIYLFGGRAASDIQKVFKLILDLDIGVKYQKCLRPELQPVGFMSNPGTNLKVFVQEDTAYIFGNIPYGVDVFDMKKMKSVSQMPIKVFEGLSDPYFQAYTLIF